MKLAVDIDGVILDMVSKVCEIYNKSFKTTYTKDDVKKWEFFRDWNITEESMYDIFYQVYENSMSLRLIDKRAPQVLRNLSEKYQADLVTARNVKFESNLLERLDSLNIMKGIQYSDLVHVDEKPYDLKLQLSYDILIDDNPNLATVIDTYPGKKLLLYNQPWNQHVQEKNKVVRVYNWIQIESILL